MQQLALFFSDRYVTGMFDEMIGPHLRLARLEAGMTQQALADALGLAAQFLMQIERGHRPLPDSAFRRLPLKMRRAVIRRTIIDMQAMED